MGRTPSAFALSIAVSCSVESHDDHDKCYVQDYIARFSVRKCEANALVVVPEIGRQLCRYAILEFVDADAPERYQRKLESSAALQLAQDFPMQLAALAFARTRRPLKDDLQNKRRRNPPR